MSEFAKYCDHSGPYEGLIAEYVLFNLFGTPERLEQFLEDNLYAPTIENIIKKQYQQAMKSLEKKLSDEFYRENK